VFNRQFSHPGKECVPYDIGIAVDVEVFLKQPTLVFIEVKAGADVLEWLGKIPKAILCLKHHDTKGLLGLDAEERPLDA
jgi:hypothetical protein